MTQGSGPPHPFLTKPPRRGRGRGAPGPTHGKDTASAHPGSWRTAPGSAGKGTRAGRTKWAHGPARPPAPGACRCLDLNPRAHGESGQATLPGPGPTPSSLAAAQGRAGWSGADPGTSSGKDAEPGLSFPITNTGCPGAAGLGTVRSARPCGRRLRCSEGAGRMDVRRTVSHWAADDAAARGRHAAHRGAGRGGA